MTAPRSDWTRPEIAALFDLPFTELVFRAATVHRAHHAADGIQLCTLLSHNMPPAGQELEAAE